MLEHLRTYLEDAQQQKMRQEKKVNAIKNQITFSYERSIDQKSLEDQLKYLQGLPGSTIAQSKIDGVISRKERDIANQSHYNNIIGKEIDTLTNLIHQIDNHGSELSEAEMRVGGFFELVVSIYDAGAYDRKDKSKIILTNKEEVHLQMSTPLMRDKWKDTCEFTIRKVEST